MLVMVSNFYEAISCELRLLLQYIVITLITLNFFALIDFLAERNAPSTSNVANEEAPVRAEAPRVPVPTLSAANSMYICFNYKFV